MNMLKKGHHPFDDLRSLRRRICLNHQKRLPLNTILAWFAIPKLLREILGVIYRVREPHEKARQIGVLWNKLADPLAIHEESETALYAGIRSRPRYSLFLNSACKLSARAPKLVWEFAPVYGLSLMRRGIDCSMG